MTNKDFLSHFGIPGMHWGKRKARPHSEDHVKKVSLSKKKMSEMSNVELKALNERLQLERQYKDLTKKEISAGRKFVGEIFKEMAKDSLKKGIKKSAKTLLKTLVDEKK